MSGQRYPDVDRSKSSKQFLNSRIKNSLQSDSSAITSNQVSIDRIGDLLENVWPSPWYRVGRQFERTEEYLVHFILEFSTRGNTEMIVLH